MAVPARALVGVSAEWKLGLDLDFELASVFSLHLHVKESHSDGNSTRLLFFFFLSIA